MSRFLTSGEGRGVSRDPAEGRLKWFAHPLGCVVCRGHAQYPAFAPHPLLLLPALQRWQLGFLVSFYLVVQNLPQLHMHTVIFSPLSFLCILLLKETFVQVQALQHCSKGSQVPACLNVKTRRNSCWRTVTFVATAPWCMLPTVLFSM